MPWPLQRALSNHKPQAENSRALIFHSMWQIAKDGRIDRQFWGERVPNHTAEEGLYFRDHMKLTGGKK